MKKVALLLDSLFENIAQYSLAAMTFVVVLQVVTRKLFDKVFFWSEEVTLLLLVWFSFMGMAIGFREKLHLAIDSFTRLLPEPLNKLLDKLIQAVAFLFGLYLIVYGWEFTKLAHESTMAATKLPTSVLYAVMPVTGVMVCVYSFLQLLGVDTVRHRDLEEEVIRK